MHGYNIAKLRGTFKRAMSRSVSPSNFVVPRSLIEEDNKVRAFMDVIFINNLPFSYSILEGVTFRIATFLLLHIKQSLKNNIQEVLNTYKNGVLILHIWMQT